MFVAAVSQLGSALARDPSAAVFARFAALFAIVFWAWVLYALHANRFDTDDLIFRLTKSAAMLAIAAIAVNLHEAMFGRGGTVGFAAGYVVLRLLLIGLYVRARRHVAGPGRKLADVYIIGYSATTGLWLLSIFVPGPFRYALWCVAMVIDLAVPTRAWAALKQRSVVVVSHLTERFGTFWIYFDLADTSVVGRGVLGLVYVYAHFPLLAGVAAFGDGTKLAITEASRPGLSAGARWALAGGIAAFALSLAKSRSKTHLRATPSHTTML